MAIRQGVYMLSALPYARVRTLLERLFDLPDSTSDIRIRQLEIDPTGIDVLFVGANRWHRAFEHNVADPENHAYFISLMQMIWGGDIEKLMTISVFHQGYAVETRTDVCDEEGLVNEVRVGRLLV